MSQREAQENRIERRLQEFVRLGDRQLQVAQFELVGQSRLNGGNLIRRRLEIIGAILLEATDYALDEMETFVRKARVARVDVSQFLEHALLRCLNGLVEASQLLSTHTAVGTAAFVQREIDRLSETVSGDVNEFAAGVWRPHNSVAATPRATNVHNVVNVSGTLQGTVQQAGEGAIQHAEATINAGDVAQALDAFAGALAAVRIGDDVRNELEAEIDTIRPQLRKASPNWSIVKAAGTSILGVTTGIVGNLLTPQAMALAAALGLHFHS